MQTIDFAIILSIVGGLVLCTNIITEVLKNVFKKLPAQITATAVAILLTAAAGGAYTSINNITIEWYMIIGDIVCGFFVSYGAQFGFDKLIEVINKYKKGK